MYTKYPGLAATACTHSQSISTTSFEIPTLLQVIRNIADGRSKITVLLELIKQGGRFLGVNLFKPYHSVVVAFVVALSNLLTEG